MGLFNWFNKDNEESDNHVIWGDGDWKKMTNKEVREAPNKQSNQSQSKGGKSNKSDDIDINIIDVSTD